MEWNVLVRFVASDVNNPANPAFKLDGVFPRPSQYPQLVFWYIRGVILEFMTVCTLTKILSLLTVAILLIARNGGTDFTTHRGNTVDRLSISTWLMHQFMPLAQNYDDIFAVAPRADASPLDVKGCIYIDGPMSPARRVLLAHTAYLLRNERAYLTADRPDTRGFVLYAV